MVTRAGKVESAVAKAVTAAHLPATDAAAVALAKHYAAAVDAGDQAAGLRLLKVLDALGLTPAGRKAPARGEVPSGPAIPSVLDELRERARTRHLRSG